MSALTEEMSRLSVELRAAEQSRDALRRELSGETESLVPDVPAASAGSADVGIRRAPGSAAQAARRAAAPLHRPASRRRLRQAPDRAPRGRQAAGARGAPPGRREAAGGGLAPAQPGAAADQARARRGGGRRRVAARACRRHAGAPGAVARFGQRACRRSKRSWRSSTATTRWSRRNYQTMVARREKAALSEDVDATRAAQFRVIDPPRTSPQPVFPNRWR